MTTAEKSPNCYKEKKKKRPLYDFSNIHHVKTHTYKQIKQCRLSKEISSKSHTQSCH